MLFSTIVGDAEHDENEKCQDAIAGDEKMSFRSRADCDFESSLPLEAVDSLPRMDNFKEDHLHRSIAFLSRDVVA